MSVIIGEISYTNIIPLFYYINREYLQQQGCTFVPQIPARLNEKMSQGEVHVGGISSFAYGENADTYQLLPDLSVSSRREVGSIFLFSKYPIEQLEGKSIALTSSSATSVNLLKIILLKFYDLDVHFQTEKPNYDEMMANYDACLLIGDDAIHASWNKRAHDFCYDLGERWNSLTGFPMTYAVFAVHKNILQTHEEVIQDLWREFTKSKSLVIEDDYQEMIRSIQMLHGGERAFWRNYFTGLNHDLTPTHLAGLQYYYDLAYDLGLLPKPVKNISIWTPIDQCHSV
ncbi:menaquinone biosynthesis protein [Texcoconibacillus texcoconensis]|uniref:Chorismate dehydratase n=1 Tax=Texcoconibacillus texcoconensis TaxID=1095777 RepID=A0A840QNI1_9BACI|nr:menaquinone biosynthesis protein [Texcoconibacillus texcoconensis]MBB5172893.1 chorismate dehydratase [Texcoconibacillus texcoconensis]